MRFSIANGTRLQFARIASTVAFFLSTELVGATAVMAEGFQGDIELLKEVADAWSANKAKIRTWRGEARVTDTMTRDGKPHASSVSDVSFAYDAARKAKRWNWTFREWTRPVDGIEKSDPEKFPHSWSNGMVKDGAFYSVIKIPQAERPSISIMQAEKASFGPMSSTFDPMFYIFDEGENLSGRLMFFHENARNPLFKDSSVRRSGTVVTTDCVTEDSLSRYVSDLTKGGQLLEFSVKNTFPAGEEADKSTYRYEQKGGAWIPKFFQYRQVQTEPGRSAISTRVLIWKTNVVNEELSEDEFELPALGVEEGDFMTDGRSGAESRFKLPEGRKPKTPPQPGGREPAK